MAALNEFRSHRMRDHGSTQHCATTTSFGFYSGLCVHTPSFVSEKARPFCARDARTKQNAFFGRIAAAMGQVRAAFPPTMPLTGLHADCSPLLRARMRAGMTAFTLRLPVTGSIRIAAEQFVCGAAVPMH
jgi:hypothetical protein